MNTNKVNPGYNDMGLYETWLQGPDYCPLIGHNPGFLLAFLLDITAWEDIYV
jgi:hypothetical protein